MSVLPVGFGSAVGGTPAGAVERSLRFNSADSAYLNRTPAGAGNRRTFTWSGWIKIAKFSFNPYIFSTGAAAAPEFISISSGDQLNIGYWNGSTYVYRVQTTQVFRDPSAWYHIVVAWDTTQATASNRLKIYVNGSEVTALSVSSYPSQNYDSNLNTAAAHYIGSNVTTAYFDGYMTEVNFINGQQLAASSFGETDSATGVWKPKAYSGTYGTNGFYLKFADNSGTTSTTLGKDSSGNGNNWTPNNFSVTAGSGNDSLVDSPTAYGTDTGVGGEVRGNYCTWNPLSSNAIPTLTNGNLDTPSNQNNKAANGIIGVSSGKWYWEITVNNNSQPCPYLGVTSRSQENDPDSAPTLAANTGRSVVRLASPYVYKNYTSTGGIATGATSTGNFGTVGVALNFDTGEIKYYFNNTLLHTDSTIPTSGVTLFPYYGLTNSGGAGWNSSSVNFGQRPFAYTAPSGFKALCTQNLPTPTIGATSTTQANDYMNVVLYNGNSSTQAITGVGFQPDFVWCKARSTAAHHIVTDAVRTAAKVLSTSQTAAESAWADNAFFQSLNSDGFTLTGGGTGINTTGNTYVAWNWKANGAGSSNTAGTITSTVSANTTSGFSIVTYTGTGANATVGHGLGVAPQMIIHKCRGTAATNWPVYHVGIGNTAVTYLNSTTAKSTTSAWLNNTSPTSTVWTIGTDGDINGSTRTYVAYCFAPVAGYSAFGSYTGNGSADGPFVYTGFRPRFVMIKRTDSASAVGWVIWDTARGSSSGGNVVGYQIYPNLSNAESSSSTNIDILSNGFKLRDTYQDWNASGSTNIYAAFAESPFKYSLAR